jgi:protein-S-isoprenylcysteine O-methyltransferase Ste14
MTPEESGQSTLSAAPALSENPLYKNLYRAFGYFGLVSIFGSQLYGFRYGEVTPLVNYWFNFFLYAMFALPHLILTRSWYKKAFWGNPAGSPRERRFYIYVTNITWFAVLIVHKSVPGFAFPEGNAFFEVVRFFGMIGFLLSALLFFQGITFEMIDGLLGVPGRVGAYSHGAETPLFTEGPYAQVRHPMYRAVLLAGLSSLLIHPNTAQLFWVVLIDGTFLLFIPVEEAQLIAARGDDYRRYQERTPWRLFKGVW